MIGAEVGNTLKMEEGPTIQEIQVVSKSWKRQGNRFSPGTLESNTALLGH